MLLEDKRCLDYSLFRHLSPVSGLIYSLPNFHLGHVKLVLGIKKALPSNSKKLGYY